MWGSLDMKNSTRVYFLVFLIEIFLILVSSSLYLLKLSTEIFIDIFTFGFEVISCIVVTQKPIFYTL
jgi:hypothetical protein